MGKRPLAGTTGEHPSLVDVKEVSAPELDAIDFAELVTTSSASVLAFDFPDNYRNRTNTLEEIFKERSRCVRINPEASFFFVTFGIDLAIGKSLAEVFSVESGLSGIISEWMKLDYPRYSFEIEVRNTKTKDTAYLQVVIYARRNHMGISRLWLVIRDCTEQAENRRMLERTETYYRSALKHAGLISVRLSPQGQILSSSEGLTDLIGWENNPESDFFDLLSERTHPSDVQTIHALKETVSQSGEKDLELAILNNGKNYRWYHVRIVSALDPQSGKHYSDLLALDIDRQKRVELEMQRMQRVELIGEVAAGVAHDFNNQLMLILAQIHELSKTPSFSDHAANQQIDLLKESVQTSADMAESLLTLGKRGKQREIVDIREPLKRSAVLLKHVLDQGMTLSVESVEYPLFVKVSKTEVHQVVMNLVLNARDALSTKGEIVLRIRNAESVDLKIHRERLQSRHSWIILSVSDDGSGIPKSQLANIFDPFFSTKSSSSHSGSGLGLAMVASIIRDLEGFVHVSSTVGVGTTFQIFLPQCQKPLSSQITVESGNILQPESNMKVLVADDDDPVRNLLVQALTLHGFSVLSARDGEEALKVFDSNFNFLSAVVLDETMPLLGGSEVASALLKRRPDMKVVLTSGYGTRKSSKSQPNLSYLGKPFSIHDLVMKLRN